MKNKKIRTKKYFAPQNDGNDRACDCPGCSEKGEYKAPKDKNLKDYFWFCLKHVQEYNARWNYYSGTEQTDEKPKSRMHFGGFRSKIRYQFGYDFIDELGIEGSFAASEQHVNVYYNARDRECAEIMEMDLEDVTPEKLKKQYKSLVKKYHPDVNSGDKSCEEKFKKIAAAYHELSVKIAVK